MEKDAHKNATIKEYFTIMNNNLQNEIRFLEKANQIFENAF